MFAAIKARFRGNEATKRTQKALLKQQYENFNASSSESLDSIFNRLQKLVSRLAILGVVTPPKDLNVKFLRSLPSEWDTHVVVWDEQPDFDTMVSTGTTKVNTASTETSTASFSDATVYAFLSTQPQGSELVHEDLEQLHDDDLEEMDLKDTHPKAVRIKDASERPWVLIDGHKEYLMGYLRLNLKKLREEKRGVDGLRLQSLKVSSKDLDHLLASQITDKSKKGFGYNVVPSPHPLILNRPTPLDLSYSGLEEFKQPETVTETSSVKSPLKVDKDWKEKFFYPANHVREEEPKKARENNNALIIEDWVSDDEEEVEPIPKVTGGPMGNQRNWICCPNAHKHMVPRAVLMKTGLKTVNNAKPVNTVRSVNTARPFSTARAFNTVRPSYTAHPKSTVLCARPKTHFQNQAQSTVQRPFYKRTTLTKRSNNQNINTDRQTVNTVRQNVNTVRARGFNAVKPSACWVWRPIKPNGASLVFNKYNYIDARGRSKFVEDAQGHMLENIAHLSDFKTLMELWDFGGGANGQEKKLLAEEL
ncbi:hypothetical protein Tco_1281795 [Tanacetum coccineum]